METIYRDFSIQLSKSQCTFLRDLAISGGSITSSFVMNNAFPEKSVGNWSMFFKLKFQNQEHLDKFHSLGHETFKPPKISGC